jgi:hypothetical protein
MEPSRGLQGIIYELEDGIFLCYTDIGIVNTDFKRRFFMKKKALSLFSLALVVLMVIMCFAACGKEHNEKTADGSMGYVTEDSVDIESVEEDINTTATSTGAVADNRKIIEKIEMTLQTKTFDNLILDIEGKIKALGGYVESSEITGREIESNNNRRATLKVRIPKAKSEEFSSFVSQTSVVIRRAVTTDDITLTYVDMESRLKALQTEKESLEKLLATASTVEDIIAVREKLTSVIGEIEAYSSKLRTFDNLVDYTTITLWVQEVERTKVVEKQNAWQEIGTNLKNNFANLWDLIVDVFVFAVSSIPYLIIPAVAVLVFIFALIIAKRKKRANKSNEK